MVERTRYIAPSVFTERATEINYDDGTVSLLNQLSGAFLDVAQKAHRAELAANVAQAKKDGVLAGSRDGIQFRPVKGKSLVHKTYNDSGIQTATIKMSSMSQTAIQRIAQNNPSNPFAQNQQMKAWADSFAQELAPEMVSAFRDTFGTLMDAQLTQANNNMQKVRQDEAIDSFNTFEDISFRGIELDAPNLFIAGEVGTDAGKSIETRRKNYLELLVRNGPGLAYSVAGFDVPEAAGRTGAFSLKEIGLKMSLFDKKVTTDALKGDFLRELEAGRGVGAYFNLVKGNTAFTTVGVDGSINQVSIAEVLDTGEMEGIASFMRTHISTLNSMEQAQDRKADRAQEQYNDAIMTQALNASFKVVTLANGEQVVRGNADMLRIHYLNAVNDVSGLVTLDTIEGLQKMMETVGTGDIANPAVIGKTKLSVIEGDIRSASQLPENGLGDAARAEIGTMIMQRNSGRHWSNSQRYTTMLDLGKAALAPEAATGFQTLFEAPGSKKSAADFAEFKEMLMLEMISAEAAGTLPADINALPAQGEFDIQARAMEIIKEIKERDQEIKKDPEIESLDVLIKEQQSILNSGTNKQAKAARKVLKDLRAKRLELTIRNIGIR